MVLASEPWILPPAALNARGQPVIHDIAFKLGCISADPSSPSAGGIEFSADAEEFAAQQSRLESEELHSTGGNGMMGLYMGGAGPEGQFGEGFDDENGFADVYGAAYGADVDHFEEGGVRGGFAMEGLMEVQQSLQQQRLFDEYLPSSSSSPPASAAAVASPGVPTQIRVPRQMQISSK